MNKQHVIFQLQEAEEQLQETLKNIQEDSEYEYGDFLVEMSHLYHHINTAWNSRESTEEDLNLCSEDNFNKWRKMPSNQELLLEP
jgi:hypothetical protein